MQRQTNPVASNSIIPVIPIISIISVVPAFRLPLSL
jgi:hypothetical protein